MGFALVSAVRDTCKIEKNLDDVVYQGKKQLNKSLKNRMCNSKKKKL